MNDNSKIFTILSIDIGIKNTSFANIVIEDGKIIDITFELCDLENSGIKNKNGIVAQRCSALKEAFMNFMGQTSFVNEIVIERQVPSNENAMCIMYCLYMMAQNINEPDEICIFDPKLKFTSLGINYDTKNKNHKKKSVQLAEKLLSNLQFFELLDKFKSEDKKDDIADAINQGVVWCYKNKKLDKLYVKDLYEL